MTYNHKSLLSLKLRVHFGLAISLLSSSFLESRLIKQPLSGSGPLCRSGKRHLANHVLVLKAFAGHHAGHMTFAHICWQEQITVLNLMLGWGREPEHHLLLEGPAYIFKWYYLRQSQNIKPLRTDKKVPHLAPRPNKMSLPFILTHPMGRREEQKGWGAERSPLEAKSIN